jgi:hypothetical protein
MISPAHCFTGSSLKSPALSCLLSLSIRRPCFPCFLGRFLFPTNRSNRFPPEFDPRLAYVNNIQQELMYIMAETACVEWDQGGESSAGIDDQEVYMTGNR